MTDILNPQDAPFEGMNISHETSSEFERNQCRSDGMSNASVCAMEDQHVKGAKGQPAKGKRYMEPATGTAYTSFVQVGRLQLLVTTECKRRLQGLSDEHGQIRELFRASVQYIVRDKPRDRDRPDFDPEEAKYHFDASLDALEYIYQTKPQSFEEFFHSSGPRELLQKVNKAATFYGIFFDGCREDKGGKWLLYLYAVASAVYMTRGGRNRYWEIADVEPYFVPMFGQYEKVGMFKQHANEFFVLTAAANWMVHFLTCKMITDAVSKTRQFQLLEMLVERRKLVSGGDATPHYCRLLIMYYSIYQYFFDKPPQGTRQVHKSNQRQRENKRLDMSTIPKIPDYMMLKMKDPLEQVPAGFGFDILDLGENEPQDVVVAKPKRTYSATATYHRNNRSRMLMAGSADESLSPMSKIMRTSSLPALPLSLKTGTTAAEDAESAEAAMVLGVMFTAAAEAEAKTGHGTECSLSASPTALQLAAADHTVAGVEAEEAEAEAEVEADPTAVVPTGAPAGAGVGASASGVAAVGVALKKEPTAPAPSAPPRLTHGTWIDAPPRRGSGDCCFVCGVVATPDSSTRCPDCADTYCNAHCKEWGSVRCCKGCAGQRERDSNPGSSSSSSGAASTAANGCCSITQFDGFVEAQTEDSLADAGPARDARVAARLRELPGDEHLKYVEQAQRRSAQLTQAPAVSPPRCYRGDGACIPFGGRVVSASSVVDVFPSRSSSSSSSSPTRPLMRGAQVQYSPPPATAPDSTAAAAAAAREAAAAAAPVTSASSGWTAGAGASLESQLQALEADLQSSRQSCEALRRLNRALDAENATLKETVATLKKTLQLAF